jgi:hypothetical protein
MELIQGKTIEGRLLSIDGKQFVDCLLINCVLNYRGLPVIHENVHEGLPLCFL